jgi:ribosome maturation factor RimP
MDKLTQLKEIIEKEINSYFENSNLFLVEVKVLTNGKIEIFADGKTNITIDECAQISKHIHHFLEENNLMSDNLSLDVSSPGMDEPLKVAQQFQKQLNKKVDVVLKNGLKITGELISANENEIIVKEVIIIKKTETIEEHTFGFSEIKSVKKHFNFKL